MSNILRDAGDGLYKWWKHEKISGTLMPIFILLNVLKFQTDTSYSANELIANASFIIVMVFAIVSFYRRSERLDKVNIQKDIGLDKNIKDQEVAMEQVKLERDKFEHKKEVEEFSMGVIEKQRNYQYGLITEQADFINEQIINKTDHIVYLSKNMEINSKVEEVIKMHEDEIEVLRLYQRALPQKIEMRFKDFLMSNKEIPRVKPAPEIIESELTAILQTIDENMTEVTDEVTQEE